MIKAIDYRSFQSNSNYTTRHAMSSNSPPSKITTPIQTPSHKNYAACNYPNASPSLPSLSAIHHGQPTELLLLLPLSHHLNLHPGPPRKHTASHEHRNAAASSSTRRKPSKDIPKISRRNRVTIRQSRTAAPRQTLESR